MPNGEWISHKGLIPDFEIKMTEDEYKKMIGEGTFTNKLDQQLLGAIKFMKKFKNRDDFIKKLTSLNQDKIKKDKIKKDEKLKKLLEK